MNGTIITISILDDCYRALYAYQEEAATEDYLEYLEAEFSPDNVDWSDRDSALGALQSLINEIYEDCCEPGEVLAECGVTQDILDVLNRSK